MFQALRILFQGIRGIILTVLLLAASAGVILLPSYDGALKKKPDIVWQQQHLRVSVVQGATVSRDFSFITQKDLTNVTVRVTSDIERYLLIQPSRFDQIAAGSVVFIQAIVTVPADLEPGDYGGTAHLQLGKKTVARPLPVKITVEPPPLPPSSGEIEIFHDDGTAEAFEFDPILGRAVFSSKFNTGSEPVQLLGVKVFLKVPTIPASPIDIYLWDINRTQTIPPVRFTPDRVSLDGEFFLIDLSSQNITVQNEFYFGIAWPSAEAPPLLGIDVTAPQGQSFVVILSNDTFVPLSNANLMIRALVKKQ